MYFLEAWFWPLMLAAAIAVRLTPSTARRWVVLGFSVAMLAWLSPETLAAAAGAGALTWALCRWVASAPEPERRKPRAWVSSGLVLTAVIAARLSGEMFSGLTVSADPVISEGLLLLGVAYLVLKLHHAVAITRFDPAQRPTLAAMLGYLLYLPTLSGGPIMRLREWHELEKAGPASWLDVEIGLRRIIWGLGKKVLLVPLMLESGEVIARGGVSPIEVPPYLALSVILIYIDFSGYCDIAIGSARLFGHRVRENFASPFMATSLSHFWRGWHITMGDWLREHIFVPFGGMRAGRAKLALLAFGTMVFCGLWHAFEWRFVWWGVFHGVLLGAEAWLGIRALPPGSPWWKLWPRRALVFAVMCISAGFFIPAWW